MSLRSPLGRALGLGSAKEGSAHWLAQRLSALALIVLGTWFLAALACLDGASLDSVRAWLRSPLAAALLSLFVATLAWHLVLGLQVVIEDYVGQRVARFALLVAVKFGTVVAAMAGIVAVLRIATDASA